MLVDASASAVAPNRTAVVLVTTLSITGRSANFGRQAMIDVGNELIGKFADCLSGKLAGRTAGGATLLGVVNPDEVAAEVAADEASPSSASTPVAASNGEAAETAPRAGSPTTSSRQPQSEPVQLLSAAKKPLLTQLLPVVGGVLLALFILFKKSQPKPKTEKDLAKDDLKRVKAQAKDAKLAVKSAKNIVAVADDEDTIAYQ